jgi:hypothetical protein
MHDRATARPMGGSEPGMEGAVDLIERAFGVAPDGGNGLLELTLFLVPLLVGLSSGSAEAARPS